MEEYLAEIRHLKIEYETEYGRVHAVNDVSFDVEQGEVLLSRLVSSITHLIGW